MVLCGKPRGVVIREVDVPKDGAVVGVVGVLLVLDAHVGPNRNLMTVREIAGNSARLCDLSGRDGGAVWNVIRPTAGGHGANGHRKAGHCDQSSAVASNQGRQFHVASIDTKLDRNSSYVSAARVEHARSSVID